MLNAKRGRQQEGDATMMSEQGDWQFRNQESPLFVELFMHGTNY